jgi:hypothetical protein
MDALELPRISVPYLLQCRMAEFDSRLRLE